VHSVKKRPNVEEQKERNARRVRRICFQEILRTELSKSPNARSAWEVEILYGSSSEGIALSISVDEIQESDSSEEQRSIPLKTGKSSESEEIRSSGGGATVVVGSQCKGSTVV
jgi:hypothetical protein